MGECPGKLWSRQARSDKDAGNRLALKADPASFCHAIAKYQQAVEKSIKGIVASLRDAGELKDTPIGRGHRVDKHVTALVRRGHPQNDIWSKIAGLLRQDRRDLIETLGKLAPRLRLGEKASRNTEYPYQNPDESWRVPCDTDSFDWHRDVWRFRLLAEKIVSEADRIIDAVVVLLH
ncbi:MAG: hypothetical protein PHU85_04090 [Phycisphaerae bacterium]|nr:hypothetical protein [Phycisphaerae bacterium]